MDLSIFATPEAWISLVTLLFLEIVLGVDNLVFIAITTDRLPPEKQHIGRKLGLLGALVMRVLFLCFASFLVHMTNPLFTIPGVYIGGEELGFSVRDLVLLFGGLYLIYKGIVEVRAVLSLAEEKEDQGDANQSRRTLSLPSAVGTIMVMDLVFSIDSVITAVGLANHLIIMIIAVMVAIILMMVFIDTISDFINAHTEMKILALVFIVTIGVLLVLDGFGLNSGIEVLDMHAEKLMVYFAMVFAIILEVLQMRYTKNFREWTAKKNLEMMRAKGFDPQRTDTLVLAQAILEAEQAAADAKGTDQQDEANKKS
ncbi:MAG: TerC family protein [Eggerthellaceae bacterium]